MLFFSLRMMSFLLEIYKVNATSIIEKDQGILNNTTWDILNAWTQTFFKTLNKKKAAWMTIIVVVELISYFPLPRLCCTVKSTLMMIDES